MEETKDNKQLSMIKFKESYYDDLHQKIVEYLTSGKVHSTLIGLIINLDGDKGKKDVIEATVFADYIINFLKKVNQ
jgi:hypothetical protein